MFTGFVAIVALEIHRYEWCRLSMLIIKTK